MKPSSQVEVSPHLQLDDSVVEATGASFRKTVAMARLPRVVSAHRAEHRQLGSSQNLRAVVSVHRQLGSPKYTRSSLSTQQQGQQHNRSAQQQAQGRKETRLWLGSASPATTPTATSTAGAAAISLQVRTSVDPTSATAAAAATGDSTIPHPASTSTSDRLTMQQRLQLQTRDSRPLPPPESTRASRNTVQVEVAGDVAQVEDSNGGPPGQIEVAATAAAAEAEAASFIAAVGNNSPAQASSPPPSAVKFDLPSLLAQQLRSPAAPPSPSHSNRKLNFNLGSRSSDSVASIAASFSRNHLGAPSTSTSIAASFSPYFGAVSEANFNLDAGGESANFNLGLIISTLMVTSKRVRGRPQLWCLQTST